ncbi:MAG: hypothetical protein V3V37_09300, partial [Candidatus Adiutricales bacterium]
MRLKIMLTGLICMSLIIPAAFFISCSDIPPEGTGAAAGPAVSSVTLLTSSPQLDSIGTESVSLTALIRDVNNNLMRDFSVTFSANSGSIQVV